MRQQSREGLKTAVYGGYIAIGFQSILQTDTTFVTAYYLTCTNKPF